MTSAPSLPAQGRSLLSPFTVAAIHDGLLAGFRAKEALRWLDHVLAPEFKVRGMAWSFQQLERLDVRSMATRSASGAQMIIVAGCSATPLSAHIERWLDACFFEHRVRRTVLVALPEEELPGAKRQQSFLHSLREFAARWQAQVMTGAEFDEEVHPEFVRKRFAAPVAPAVPAAPAALPASRWSSSFEFEAVPRFYGIND